MDIFRPEIISGNFIQESGAREKHLREVVENYKQICNSTLAKFECGYDDKKDLLKAVRNMLDHLFEQNSLILTVLEKRDVELKKLVSEKENLISKCEENLLNANKVNKNNSMELEKAVAQIEILENELKMKNEDLKLALIVDSMTEKVDQATAGSLDLEAYKNQVQNLEDELNKKKTELSNIRDEMKAMDANFKETKWALAGEVSEKHDQVLKLHQLVSNLEEKLLQADKTTHFKDDIIKRMRAELKNNKATNKSEGPKLCDVVAEVTQQQRKLDVKMTIDGELNEKTTNKSVDPGTSGSEPVGTHDLSLSASESKMPSPKEQLASLREILLADIQKMESPTIGFEHQHAELKGRRDDVKPKRMADLGGGDGEDALVSSDSSTSLYTARDASSQYSLYKDVRTQIDSLVANTKQNDDSNMNEQTQLVRNELMKIEEYLIEGDFFKSTRSSKDDVLILLKKKQATIENLQRELNNLKDRHKESCSLSDKNIDHFLHLVDRFLKKIPLNNNLIPDNGDTSVEDLERKLLILENSFCNICEELAAERKLVSNKEEILQNLHDTVQLRENQAKSSAIKVIDLEKQLEEQRNVIAELQQAVQNCKKVEIKEKDQEIRSLRFGFCELEEKQVIYEKECKKLKFSLEQAQSENCHFKDKLSLLERVVPRIKDLQEISILYKEKNLELERDLLSSETEVNKLQNQLTKLEEENSIEVERNEGRLEHDAKVITAYRGKIEELRACLRQLQNENKELISQAQMKYLSLKTQTTDQQRKMLIQIENLVEKNENLEMKCIELSEFIRLTEGQIRECRETEKKFEKKVESLEQKLKANESKTVNMEKYNVDSMKAVKLLTIMADEEKRNKTEVQAKLEQCQTELHKSNEKLKKLNGDYEDFKESNERVIFNLKKRLAQFENDNNFLQTEVLAMKTKSNGLAENISMLRDKNRNAESTINSLLNELQECENQNGKLNSTIKVLHAEAEHANSSCLRMQELVSRFVDLMEGKDKLSENFSSHRQNNCSQLIRECLQDFHHNKGHGGNATTGCDPWMPIPPAAHTLWNRQRTNLHDSSECFVESGIQSMVPSPVPTLSDTPTCSYSAETEPQHRLIR